MAVRNGFDVADFTINVIGGYSDAATRSLSLKLIEGYQKYISPRKGFSCAYRILYNRESCSQYVKRQIREQGLINAIPLIRQRFLACKSASLAFNNRTRSVANKDCFAGGTPNNCIVFCTPDDLGTAAACCSALNDSNRR